jgi:hypothetical protein
MTMTVPIAGTIVRRVKRERPDIVLGWRDADSELLDLSGYTFSFSVALSAASASIFTKTTGITYEVDPEGIFNVRILFTTGELDALIASVPYNCQLDATSAARDRGFQDFILFFTPAHS